MFVEFDDKYKPMIVVRRILLVVLLTRFIGATTSQVSPTLVNLAQDTVPCSYLFLNGSDTTLSGNDWNEIYPLALDFLQPFWKKGYALARWELKENQNKNCIAQYYFVQDALITKGKIVGWDAQILDPKLAPFIMDWKDGRLLQSRRPSPISSNLGITITHSSLFFEDSIAHLRVNLVSSQNQYFDGILGLQQMKGKSVLVGDFKMNWVNQLKKGESLYLRWQRQDVATQRLELNAVIPYLFHQPFGWANYFDFFRKKDQLFQTQLKSQIILHLQNDIQWSSGIELKNNQNLLAANQLFSRHQMWVNTWTTKNTSFEFSAGARKISQTINETTHNQKDKIYRWEAHWTRELTGKSAVLNLKFHSSGYLAKALDMAELLRIGGAKNIRGFNVESIFARQWNGLQTEWGYQLTNTTAYLFADAGFKDNIAIQRLHQSYGLGAKINRKDIALVLEYGWGVFPKQSIDFRQGILHIGFNQRL